MRIMELKRAAKAPGCGMALILTRSKVIYRPYGSLADVDAMMDGLDVLEIHLSDQSREYRCVKSESRRFGETGGFIEHIADFKEETFSVYEETVLLENRSREESGKETITILNHISYDDDPEKGSGMAFIDDYRLKG